VPDRYLDDLAEQVDFLEITHDLARAAGRPAREHGLRGHDAVHLAAGIEISDHDVMFITGDRDLAAAAMTQGLATATPSAPPT